MSVLQLTDRLSSVRQSYLMCHDPMKIRIGRLLRMLQGENTKATKGEVHQEKRRNCQSLFVVSHHSERHIYSTQSLGPIIAVANYYYYYTATTPLINIHQTQQHSIGTTQLSPYPSLAALPTIHALAANSKIRKQSLGRKRLPRHW